LEHEKRKKKEGRGTAAGVNIDNNCFTFESNRIIHLGYQRIRICGDGMNMSKVHIS
jgi:hypothetical protein